MTSVFVVYPNMEINEIFQSNDVALKCEILSSKLLNVKYLTPSDVKYSTAVEYEKNLRTREGFLCLS